MIVTLFALLALAPQDAPKADNGSAVKRVRSVTVGAGQDCPKSTDEEIIVCSTLDEPYRIPKQFREVPKQTPESTSWAVKTDRVMEDNRKVLPGSCSPIGMNGQSGCSQKAIDAWAAERRAVANGQTVTPP
jgi:hypothetical protein